MNMQTSPAAGWAQGGRQLSIAIIGAGMSGIAAVVKLRKAGYTDLTVYEKADRVWWYLARKHLSRSFL